MLHKDTLLLLCNLSIDFWETMCYTNRITIRNKIVVTAYYTQTRSVSTHDAPARDKSIDYTLVIFSPELHHTIPVVRGEGFREKIFFRN